MPDVVRAKLDPSLRMRLADLGSDAQARLDVVIGLRPDLAAPDFFEGVALRQVTSLARGARVNLSELARLSQQPWVRYLKLVDRLKPAVA